jgi:hypothetical protein
MAFTVNLLLRTRCVLSWDIRSRRSRTLIREKRLLKPLVAVKDPVLLDLHTIRRRESQGDAGSLLLDGMGRCRSVFQDRFSGTRKPQNPVLEKGSGEFDGLLVCVQERHAVRADLKMRLKLRGCPVMKFRRQIVQDEGRDLLTGHGGLFAL